jgi:copper homeostasis protein
MNKKILIEVCANSVTSALAAQKGGASRVELCQNLKEGGTTPSFGEITTARKLLRIDLYVLIRPRGGDFLYSDLEFEIMQRDVEQCINLGCNGIVIGILNKDGSVDIKRNSVLINMAKKAGLGITFHRAFDMCADMHTALENVIEIGCERILTSGGMSKAYSGLENLKNLIQQANNRIIIMPGSGVNETNVREIVNFTGASEIHLSARSTIKSKMDYVNPNISMGGDSGNEYLIDMTDANKVLQILNAFNN